MKIIKFFKGFIDSNIQYIKGEFEKRKINLQRDFDYRNLYEIVHKNAVPIFVLSTGRCGTALLTEIFHCYKNIDVHHEPIPELIYYSKFAYENYKTKSKEIKFVVDAARYDQIRNSFLLNKTFIETNNRITFFAYQLSELYPHANFIHLIRNPISFIKSGLARNWYTGKNSHDEGHIILYNNLDAWNKFSQTEKIAWLWNETNQFIEDFKSQIKPERVITVYAEDLFKNPETTKEIFYFLNQNPLSNNKIGKIIKIPVNRGNIKKINSNEIHLNDQLKEILPLSHKYQYF